MSAPAWALERVDEDVSVVIMEGELGGGEEGKDVGYAAEMGYSLYIWSLQYKMKEVLTARESSLLQCPECRL